MSDIVEMPVGPLAEPDAVGAPFWDATRARRLVVQTCAACGHRQHYPRPLCLACGSEELRFDAASGRGVVHSHTTVARAPFPELEPPYTLAIVELDEGVRLLTQIVNAPDGVSCDEVVEVAWAPLPDGRHLPVFQPIA